MCLLSYSFCINVRVPGEQGDSPDGSFHNLRAKKSGDQIVLFRSGTPCDGYLSSQVVKRSVGRALRLGSVALVVFSCRQDIAFNSGSVR